MIPQEWFHEASRRIRDQIIRTPLTYDPDFDLYLKWENRQQTGSFKIRGALNKILSLQAWEQQRGLVTASAGNHGQGVAIAGRLAGAPVIVFASEHAVPAKLEAMRSLGADVRLVHSGYEAAEQAGIAFAAREGLTWVSPYNDPQTIAGQGTLGLEIFEQMDALAGSPRPGAILVPVGGGGLLAGVAIAARAVDSRAKVIGVQSQASPFFHALYYTGSQAGVIEEESLADGLAGAVEEGSITVPLAKRYATEIRLVTEAAIAWAIALANERYGEVIEGSAGAALAAAVEGRRNGDLPPGPVVVVISGGNIQPETHAAVCAREARG